MKMESSSQESAPQDLICQSPSRTEESHSFLLMTLLFEMEKKYHNFIGFLGSKIGVWGEEY